MVRGTAAAFFNNWKNPKWSLAEKIQLSAKNTAIKVKNRSSCCGNHDEPGC
jgi:hypothetical protein